jgi:hypothetical protein
MTTKTLFTATAPDGTLISRNSVRDYTHAVLVCDGTRWDIRNWCGSLALAQAQVQQAQQAQLRGCYDQVALVPVN